MGIVTLPVVGGYLPVANGGGEISGQWIGSSLCLGHPSLSSSGTSPNSPPLDENSRCPNSLAKETIEFPASHVSGKQVSIAPNTPFKEILMDHAERDAFKAKLARNRVIPAVRDDFSLIKALNAPGEIVFVLYGDILTLDMKVEKILKHGKMPFIHLGMIFGFANNPIMLNYLFRYFQRECGVITTKSSMAKAALGMGIRVIQRYFILDSLSLDGATQVEADAIEVMPGILPGVNAYMSQRMSVPIIAGGLIQTVREVEESLASGATAISTSQTMLWNFKQS